MSDRAAKAPRMVMEEPLKRRAPSSPPLRSDTGGSGPTFGAITPVTDLPLPSSRFSAAGSERRQQRTNNWSVLRSLLPPSRNQQRQQKGKGRVEFSISIEVVLVFLSYVYVCRLSCSLPVFCFPPLRTQGIIIVCVTDANQTGWGINGYTSLGLIRQLEA